MMTPQEEKDIRVALTSAQVTYRRWYAHDGISREYLASVENGAVGVIGNIIASRDTEIERLRAENAELTRLKDEVCRLSNVGELFDGRDECNEFTHEENNKVMEGALDRIWELATGKAQIEE